MHAFIAGKGLVFAGSPVRATASARWYCLIQTSKLNGVEPHLYLRYVLSRLPDSRDPTHYSAFLPWNINKASLLDFDGGHLY